MIVGSLLLILVAIALLVLGLADGSSTLLISSIAASLLAALALVVGARQAARAGRSAAATPRGGGTGVGGRFGWRRSGDGRPGRGATAQPASAARAASAGATTAGHPIPVQQSRPSDGTEWAPADPPSDAVPDADPVDEPAAQFVPATDADRVARLTDDVLVVDGRPRYHVAGCPHLVGRTSEPVPVNEALDLGFTPCSMCEPDTALLAGPRRG
ncbi:hypothetical protein [Plantactinospora sp. GCM10030261]|uniref:hypothetical protein n=1 Tax=Plantactinospora sp. GCM10030261 TaxID=3273420 RepID=UPI00361E38DE